MNREERGAPTPTIPSVLQKCTKRTSRDYPTFFISSFLHSTAYGICCKYLTRSANGKLLCNRNPAKLEYCIMQQLQAQKRHHRDRLFAVCPFFNARKRRVKA